MQGMFQPTFDQNFEHLLGPLPVTSRYPGIAHTHHCGVYIERLSLLLLSRQTGGICRLHSLSRTAKVVLCLVMLL